MKQKYLQKCNIGKLMMKMDFHPDKFLINKFLGKDTITSIKSFTILLNSCIMNDYRKNLMKKCDYIWKNIKRISNQLYNKKHL
jgi:hypothetical protein